MLRVAVSVLSILMLVSFLTASGQPSAANITPQQVADALRARNLSPAADQVKMPSHIPARVPNALLEVISAISTNHGNVTVRLRCRDSRNCLPFYAVVDGIRSEQLAKGPPAPLGTSNALSSPIAAGQAWLVRRGERATLLLERDHLRVEMPVICLANGSAGTTIRVTTLNHKQFYRVQVAGAGLLKGGL